ncbi:MAG TPA: adenosylcobinamide-GDP ribazoletransferase [Negativicutes bacterium]
MRALLGKMMVDFITGLQFLTRIHIITQSECSLDSFGGSVKFFPVIGGIVGLFLVGVVEAAQSFWELRLPVHVIAIGVIVVEILLTGGLHCDGFMDTIDGILSGRPRERMLEIMKDSRVGAFGAMSFGLLVLLKYSLIIDIEPALLPVALLVMPITGRTGIVIAITLYPYARASGLGKIFYRGAHRYTLCVAGMLALLLLVPLGKTAVISGVAGSAVAFAFSEVVNKRLSGLTGDVYGAVNEIAEIAALLVFIL